MICPSPQWLLVCVSNTSMAAWYPRSVWLSVAAGFEGFRLAQSLRMFSLSKWFLVLSPRGIVISNASRAVCDPVARTASCCHQDHFLVVIQLSLVPESQALCWRQLPTLVYMAFPFPPAFQSLLPLWQFLFGFISFCHPSMVCPCYLDFSVTEAHGTPEEVLYGNSKLLKVHSQEKFWKGQSPQSLTSSS